MVGYIQLTYPTERFQVWVYWPYPGTLAIPGYIQGVPPTKMYQVRLCWPYPRKRWGTSRVHTLLNVTKYQVLVWCYWPYPGKYPGTSRVYPLLKCTRYGDVGHTLLNVTKYGYFGHTRVNTRVHLEYILHRTA